MPSEWFWHVHDMGLPTLLNHTDAMVSIEVNGVLSICRTARNSDGHVARCALVIDDTARHGSNATTTDPQGPHGVNRSQPAADAAPTRKVAVATYRERERRQGELMWSAMKAERESDSPLIIPAGETWRLDADMDCEGLIIYGQLKWERSVSGLTLRANYVLVEGAGQLHIGSQESPMNNAATVYIKNSTDAHPHLGRRFIGGYRGLSEAFSQINATAFHSMVSSPPPHLLPHRTAPNWAKRNVRTNNGNECAVVVAMGGCYGWLRRSFRGYAAVDQRRHTHTDGIVFCGSFSHDVGPPSRRRERTAAYQHLGQADAADLVDTDQDRRGWRQPSVYETRSNCNGVVCRRRGGPHDHLHHPRQLAAQGPEDDHRGDRTSRGLGHGGGRACTDRDHSC